MYKTSYKERKWERHKEVIIQWVTYDTHRTSECKRVIDLRETFVALDRPVQRREFRLSQLTVLILFKLIFDISYRTLASATKDLGLFQALTMKRAPCYKTIQTTMQYLSEDHLREINKGLIPQTTPLGGVDSSGMKTHRRGARVVLRFHLPQHRPRINISIQYPLKYNIYPYEIESKYNLSLC
jgi:hypothetical protein